METTNPGTSDLMGGILYQFPLEIRVYD
jgi:hypothetical protein